MDSNPSTYFNMMFGDFNVATLPQAAPDNAGRYAYVTDRPGGAGNMMSNGVSWVIPVRRTETYNSTTGADGTYTVVFATPYASTPHINPVTYPAADSDTRVRVTAASNTGFTVKTEKNVGLTVLSLTVLGFGSAAVPSVPVRVLVVES